MSETMHLRSETTSPAETPSALVRPNPFATPSVSTPNSMPPSKAPSLANEYYGKSTARAGSEGRPFFRSRRVEKGEIDTPRNGKTKNKKEKWLWILPTIGIVAGLAITGYLVYSGLKGGDTHKYCSVFDESFSGDSLNLARWQIEQQVGGFGNGEFDQGTADPENVFVKGNQLHIKPTLQNADWVNSNHTINLLDDHSCTSSYWADCISATNVNNGTIVPPVRSARIRSRDTIKYGRVEVTAKLPKGDWMWPAIWLLPKDSVYGAWPASGEIDIMESRGNNHTYPAGGNNIASSALHWGPEPDLDRYLQTVDTKPALHSEYGDGFHTYGMEWTEDYIFTYIDTRLLQVLYVPFNERFWQKGNFPAASQNGTRLVDPWTQTGRDATPFDQDFYLILNVAVGGTNGWFPDGQASKPWVDASPTARRDFWNARNQWYPTWQGADGQMIVDRVQMWKQC